VELGNEYKRLLAEEKNEIERILSGLTAMLSPFADEIHMSVNVMARWT
jgi:dsDNA-specific endonuclease/ATPase MutS2